MFNSKTYFLQWSWWMMNVVLIIMEFYENSVSLEGNLCKIIFIIVPKYSMQKVRISQHNSKLLLNQLVLVSTDGLNAKEDLDTTSQWVMDLESLTQIRITKWIVLWTQMLLLFWILKLKCYKCWWLCWTLPSDQTWNIEWLRYRVAWRPGFDHFATGRLAATIKQSFRLSCSISIYIL